MIADDETAELLYDAWCVVANSPGWNGSDPGPEWKAAAERWRDRYHSTLHAAVPSPDNRTDRDELAMKLHLMYGCNQDCTDPPTQKEMEDADELLYWLKDRDAAVASRALTDAADEYGMSYVTSGKREACRWLRARAAGGRA